MKIRPNTFPKMGNVFYSIKDIYKPSRRWIIVDIKNNIIEYKLDGVVTNISNKKPVFKFMEQIKSGEIKYENKDYDEKIFKHI